MSDNGTDWTNVKEIYWTNGGIDDVTGFFGTGRYIRLYGVSRATANSYSVYEFEAYSPDAPNLPEPSGTPALAYDANGNMLSEGIRCYEYNNANQLSKVKRCANGQIIAEYIYDYKGMRLIKKNYNDGALANTVISWSDSFETKDIVGGSIETTNYFFANNEMVAKKNPDGSKVYFHNDHLGSNTLTTNQWGSQVEVVAYDPWGKVLGSANQSKFQFTGQEKDNETGLNYYGARYYNSDLKRFTQPDPFIQDIYNPQSLNRYTYALNNPLKYTDPTGHVSITNIFNSVAKAVNSVVKAVSGAVSTVKKVASTVSSAANSATKAVSAFVSNAAKPQGQGLSTYNLPSNSVPNNAKVNLPNQSGSNVNVQNGYNSTKSVSIGFSVGEGFSRGGGVKFGETGSAIYGTGGRGTALDGPSFGGKKLGTPLSWSAIISDEPIKPGINGSMTISYLFAIQVSMDPSYPLGIKPEGIGMGCCGIDMGAEATSNIVPYQDPAVEAAARYRSKDLKEVYGR
jgi:RHS repeat-associated protein